MKYFGVLKLLPILGLIVYGLGQKAYGSSKSKKLSGITTENVSEIVSGVVTQTMNGQGNTYVAIENGGKEVWAATRETLVSVGDKVTFKARHPRINYYSSGLERSFDLIYFVPEIEVSYTPHESDV